MIMNSEQKGFGRG